MTRETLVLVPGLNCTSRLYEPQIAAFGEDREIIVADHGRNERMEAVARRLLGAAPGRFALAGLSMGGYVGLELMRQAPERVIRLALMDTNARADTDEARQNREHLIALARDGRFAEVHEALWPKLVHPSRRHDGELERVVRGMADETGAEAFIRQQQAIMSRRDMRPHLSAITVPTLVLVGAEDVLTPVEQSREMAALIAPATLVVVPECGHLSTLERPHEANRAFERWLGA